MESFWKKISSGKITECAEVVRDLIRNNKKRTLNASEKKMLDTAKKILISEFYGTVAIVIAILLFIFHYFSIMNFISVSLVMILGITLRLIAYFRDWHLPKIT